MVKIPSLDDLKKASSDLVDSAKTAGFSGVIEKLKSGLESVGASINSASDNTSGSATGAQTVSKVQMTGPLKDLLQAMRSNLVELSQLQVAQTDMLKKIDSQFIQLTQMIEAGQSNTDEAKPQ